MRKFDDNFSQCGPERKKSNVIYNDIDITQLDVMDSLGRYAVYYIRAMEVKLFYCGGSEVADFFKYTIIIKSYKLPLKIQFMITFYTIYLCYEKSSAPSPPFLVQPPLYRVSN